MFARWALVVLGHVLWPFIVHGLRRTKFGAAVVVGERVWVNRAYCALMGVPFVRTMPLRSWFDHVHGANAEAVFAMYRADRANNWAQTRLLNDISDHVMYGAITGTRLGPFETWICVDVTASVDVAERYRLFFETSSTPCFIHYFDESFHANPALSRMLGMDAESFSVEDWSPELQPDGRPSGEKAADMIRTAQLAGSHVFEWLLLRADGTEVVVEVTLTYAEMATGPCLLGIWHDQTARRAQEESLRAARDAAEANLAARQRFLATMSHELRTPMNGVLGLTESLLSAREPLTETQRGLLETIYESGKTLRVLLDDVLDFSKLEAGKVELEVLPFDLAGVCKKSVSLLSGRADSEGVRLEAHLPPEGETIVVGDATRVGQIVSNLLSNAIKFAKKGRVSVVVEREGRAWAIEVEDDGIGMTEAQLGTIFEPFRQADASTTRRFGGTGLGLTIVRTLVESMGGTLSVESAPGEGSRFRVVLPLPPGRLPSADLEDLVVRGESLLPPRVLAAEDNRVNRMVLGRMFEGLPSSLYFVEDGSEVLDAWRRFDPQLVLMDVHMPIMDGLEATRQLRSAGYQGPILAITASCLQEELDARIEAGMSAVLNKPLQRDQLFEALGNLAWDRSKTEPSR